MADWIRSSLPESFALIPARTSTATIPAAAVHKAALIALLKLAPTAHEMRIASSGRAAPLSSGSSCKAACPRFRTVRDWRCARRREVTFRTDVRAGPAPCTVCAVENGRVVTEEAQLRDIIGPPKPEATAKIVDRLNGLTRQFIEHSPFLCVATGRPDGGLDISPRGDPEGFVRILDQRTLLLPERPGNRIADTLTNLLEDPRIALLFLIPGVGDTFRVNGRARVVDDPELLGPSAVDGKVPSLGILISIEEAYTQCAKALIRSDLWNPERHIDRSELPSSGKILRSLTDSQFDAEAYDRERAERYARREGLY